MQYNISDKRRRILSARINPDFALLANVAARRAVAGEEFVMQTIGVLVLTAIGMALPQAVLDCGARHGKFVYSSGKVSVTSFEVLQGQSA